MGDIEVVCLEDIVFHLARFADRIFVMSENNPDSNDSRHIREVLYSISDWAIAVAATYPYPVSSDGKCPLITWDNFFDNAVNRFLTTKGRA